MTITGKIKSRRLFGCYAVDFYSEDEEYVASVSLDTENRRLDEYNISYPNTTKENTLYLKGLFFKELTSTPRKRHPTGATNWVNGQIFSWENGY